MSIISRKNLATIIADMSESVPADRLASAVAAYLLSERRTNELAPLMRDVMRIRESRGTLEVNATTAFPLAKDLEAKIKTMFDAKKVVITNDVDPSVIGGVRLASSDTLLDLTVRNQLNKLKIRSN